MVLPCEDNLLRNIAMDRPTHTVGRFDSLARDIETALTNVVERELDLQRKSETYKHDLLCRYDYS